MGPKTKELVETLDKLIDILNRDGQSHWSKWMRQAKSRIEASDFSGVEKVLQAYGGMGSFNDTYLTKIDRENENFSSLQSKAWDLATAISHDHESNT